MVSEETLNEAVRRLVQGFDPERIILFGSQARGTAHPRSDVDLMIVHKDADGPGWGGFWSAVSGSLSGMGLPCDLVIMTPREFNIGRKSCGTVTYYAAAEGRVLYERAA